MTLVLGVLVFVAIATTVALLLCLVIGQLETGIAWFSLIVGLLAGVGTWCKLKPNLEKLPPMTLFDKIAGGLFLLFCSRQFFWIYYFEGEEIKTNTLSQATDLPFHIAYIRYFVEGSPFWPNNPLYVGDKLHYHFGMDLFSALWVKIGVPLTSIFPAVALVSAVLAWVALYRWGRGFALLGFLFSGGIAGWQFVTMGPVHDYLANLHWFHQLHAYLPFSSFIPQRGFYYAIPAGLILLWSWKNRFITDDNPLPPWLEGLLWGLMPLFHMQSFLFVSFVWLLWLLGSRRFKSGFQPFYWAAIPAAFEVFSLTNNLQAGVHIKLNPYWLVGASPLLDLILDYGLFLFAIGLALFLAVRQNNRQALFYLLPGIFLFELFTMVLFAQQPWDNTKLTLWCFLLMLPAVDQLVFRPQKLPVKILLVLLLFSSGFLAHLNKIYTEVPGFPLLRREEATGICKSLEKISHEAPIVTAPTVYHPVSWCGRRIVAGYGSYLFSMGIDPKPIESVQQALMMGVGDWEKRAKQLKAKYLFWGHREEAHYQGSHRPWEITRALVASGSWGTLYDLTRQPLHPVTVPEQSGNGLWASYFTNVQWSGAPIRQRRVYTTNLYWEGENRPFTPFGLIYEGEIYIPDSGSTGFFLASDDGSDLWIDGEQVIDNLGRHTYLERYASVELKKGWHPFRLRYYDIEGRGLLNLRWQPVGMEMAANIPMIYFRSQTPKGELQ